MEYLDETLDINTFEKMASAYYESTSGVSFMVIKVICNKQEKDTLVKSIEELFGKIANDIEYIGSFKKTYGIKSDLNKHLDIIKNKLKCNYNIVAMNKTPKMPFCNALKNCAANCSSLVQKFLNLINYETEEKRADLMLEVDSLLQITTMVVSLFGDCKYRW